MGGYRRIHIELVDFGHLVQSAAEYSVCMPGVLLKVDARVCMYAPLQFAFFTCKKS